MVVVEAEHAVVVHIDYVLPYVEVEVDDVVVVDEVGYDNHTDFVDDTQLQHH